MATPAPSANLTVSHAPDAVLLHRYPLLAYAPAQWGGGVRTEDNGTPVSSIAAAAAAGKARDAIAAEFKTTEAHVRDALRYAEDAAPAA